MRVSRVDHRRRPDDFCEGGSLAVTGGAQVAADISAALAAGDDGWDHVVATKDFHIDPGDHFSAHPDYTHSWPAHCVADTSGSDFHPSLDTERVEATFTKGEHTAAYSGFEGHAGGVRLYDWLRSHDVSEVEIVGIATDYCVRATTLDAVRAGFDTTVRLDLTAGVAPESTARAIEEMSAAGAKLVSAKIDAPGTSVGDART
jgi:nicotinamidase/pyrazinamidase